MSDTVLVEDQGAVRVLTLNRPTKLNAMNVEMVDTLIGAVRAADLDDRYRRRQHHAIHAQLSKHLAKCTAHWAILQRLRLSTYLPFSIDPRRAPA